MKKIVALMLATAMSVSMAACAKKEAPKPTEAPAAAPVVTEAPAEVASVNAAEAAPETVQAPAENELIDSLDAKEAAPADRRDSAAATVGAGKITCGELEDYYNYMVQMYQMYGMAAPTAEEDITSITESCLDLLIEEKVLSEKAKEMGADKLTAEQEEQLKAQVAEERAGLIEAYAEQVTVSGTDAEKEAAIVAKINEDIAAYLGEQMDLDTYLETVVAPGYRDQIASENLEKQVMGSVTVSEEDVKAAYDKYLAEDKTAAEKDPLSYGENQEQVEIAGGRPVLFVPEGYKRIKVLTIAPETELSADYALNKDKMTELEREFGVMMLNGTADDVRADEIRTEYESLKTANETMYEAYTAPAREKAQAAYAELTAGTAFMDVARKYIVDADMSVPSLDHARLIYMEGADNWDDEIRATVAGMEPGTYSEPIEIEGSYAVVYLEGVEPAGEKEFESVKDALTSIVTEQSKATVWNDTLEQWKNDAGFVVRHPENYGYIGRA
ncbi:MAG: peptidyl-prolyl cis-trans isomerase [Clostridia bacterium]|nr:peptidyl-prolyl cis-trans isomerase [Clostridia bacterium]